MYLYLYFKYVLCWILVLVLKILLLSFSYTVGLKPTSFTNPIPHSFTSFSQTASTDYYPIRFF